MQFNLEALRYTIETSQNDLLHYLKFNVSDVLKCFKDTVMMYGTSVFHFILNSIVSFTSLFPLGF